MSEYPGTAVLVHMSNVVEDLANRELEEDDNREWIQGYPWMTSLPTLVTA